MALFGAALSDGCADASLSIYAHESALPACAQKLGWYTFSPCG